MESAQQSERATYRAIVLGQGGNELLLSPESNGFVLPSVEIERWQRIAENITAAMRNEWGQEVICLFTPDIAGPSDPAKEHGYQVMESHGQIDGRHAPTAWVPVSSLSEHAFVDPAAHLVVQRSLATYEGPDGGDALGPFARLGWFKELQTWGEEAVKPLGLRLSGRFTQLNASPSFSLVRLETNRSAIWFKAVGEPNLREFSITLALARLFPQYIPTLLAARPAWNGWLALEVEGADLAESYDSQHWKAAASTLAKLQMESIGRSGELIDAGARDLRVPGLLKLVHPFLEVMGQLMELQTKTPPPALSRKELRVLGERIQEGLCLWQDLGIPDALGLLDLNPGNVIASECRCVFLDWAEAYVGAPVFSFQYLVEHFRRNALVDATAESSLTSAYAEEWQSLVPQKRMAKALALAPMLAAFGYASASDAWSDPTRLQDARSAGYLRSLTRRINHEAKQLRERSALCPS